MGTFQSLQWIDFTLDIGQLKGYACGVTLHIIVLHFCTPYCMITVRNKLA